MFSKPFGRIGGSLSMGDKQPPQTGSAIMSVSFRIKAAMEGSSWIRRMFEEGRELKAKLGPEKVCDFTLGNPDLEPPPRFKAALLAAARDSRPGLHGYMANAGLPETRQTLAEHLGRVHQLDFTADDLVLTVGAAGALNIIFKAILDPGGRGGGTGPLFRGISDLCR